MTTYSDKQLLTYAFYMLDQARQDQLGRIGAEQHWLTGNQTFHAISARVEEIQLEDKGISRVPAPAVRPMALHPHARETYRGVTIWRNHGPGYVLRYTAVVNGKPLASDTLEGMRVLIRDALAP